MPTLPLFREVEKIIKLAALQEIFTGGLRLSSPLIFIRDILHPVYKFFLGYFT